MCFGVYHVVLMYAVHNRIVRRYFRHCIVGEKSMMAAFVQGQAINSYHFRHNRGRFVFSVSIMGFWGMPYIVVLSENILDIASWVKSQDGCYLLKVDQ